MHRSSQNGTSSAPWRHLPTDATATACAFAQHRDPVSFHIPPQASCHSQGPCHTISGVPGEYKIYCDFLRQWT